MFAPGPRQFNLFMNAEIIFADSSSKIFEFPRIEQMDQWHRYVKDFYHKWASDRGGNRFSYLWPAAARYVARQYANPSLPIREIRLIRYRRQIADPFLDEPQEKSGDSWTQEIFYQSNVEPTP